MTHPQAWQRFPRTQRAPCWAGHMGGRASGWRWRQRPPWANSQPKNLEEEEGESNTISRQRFNVGAAAAATARYRVYSFKATARRRPKVAAAATVRDANAAIWTAATAAQAVVAAAAAAMDYYQPVRDQMVHEAMYPKEYRQDFFEPKRGEGSDPLKCVRPKSPFPPKFVSKIEGKKLFVSYFVTQFLELDLVFLVEFSNKLLHILGYATIGYWIKCWNKKRRYIAIFHFKKLPCKCPTTFNTEYIYRIF